MSVTLYADSSTLRNIYLPFINERRYDSLKKYDYSFGTFRFDFLLDNEEQIIVIGTRVQSAVYLQKIICKLSANNENEVKIIKEINDRLGRINY
jgi:hypothetical protein